MTQPGAAESFGVEFAGRRVLVTGHTGFKGAWLCTWLEQLGAVVTGLALDPPTDPALHVELSKGRAGTDLRGDVRSQADVEGAFAKADPEIVFHLAAQSLVLEGYQQPVGTFATNVMGTVHVSECVRRSTAVRAYVVVTSDKCYQNQGWDWGYREGDTLGGRDPYSASKAAAELVAEAYRASFLAERKVGIATVRAGNVVGGGDWARDRIVPDAVRALLGGVPIVVRNPSAIRPWQHVLEPLHGYLLLASRLIADPVTWSGAWNFGPDPEQAVAVSVLCDRLVSSWGGGSWKESSHTSAPHEASVLRLNSDRARARLGWRPRWGLDRTVDEVATWYRRHADGTPADALCRMQIDAYLRST